MLDETELEEGFVIGDWEVLPKRRIIRNGDDEITPEPKVFKVLMCLALRNGDVVTREDFTAEVWDGRATADDPINRAVSQLRKHLGDSRPFKYVDVVSREGYRLLMPVQPICATEYRSPPPAAIPGRRKVAILVVSTLVAAIIFAVIVEWIDGKSRQQSAVTIALMPVKNVTGDPANDYLGSGFKAELLQTLHRLPGVSVKNIRRDLEDLTTSLTLRRLKTDYVLTAELFRSGDKLSVYYSLAGDDGVVIDTERVEGDIDQIYALQESLATRVSEYLFGSDAPKLLKTRSQSLDAAAYDRYMRALYLFDRRGESGNLSAAISLFRESIELDPKFGPAYLLLAESYMFAPVYMSDSLPGQMHQLAIDTVEAGIRHDRDIRDPAATVYGFVFHKRKRWSDSEREFERAMTADLLDSNAFNLYSQMLASVGRLDESLEYAIKAHDIDPTSTVMNSRVALAATWVDDRELAREFFEHTAELGDGGATHALGHALFHFREEDIDAVYRTAVASVSALNLSPAWIEPVIAALTDPGSRQVGLSAVDTASAEGQISRQAEFFVRSYLDDIEGAMNIANLLLDEGEVFEMDILWIRETRAFREHPGFLPFISKLGIPDYWDDRGCSFVNDKVTCP